MIFSFLVFLFSIIILLTGPQIPKEMYCAQHTIPVHFPSEIVLFLQQRHLSSTLAVTLHYSVETQLTKAGGPFD